MSLTVLRMLSSGLDVLAVAGVGLIAGISASSLDSSPGDIQFAFLSATVDSQLLVFLVLLVFGGFIAKSLLSFLLVRQTALFLAKVETRIARETAALFFQQSRHRIDATTQGELQWVVGQSMTIAFSVIPFAGLTLVTEIAVVIAIFSLMLIIEPWLGLGIAVFLAISVIFFQLFIRGPLNEAGTVAAETNVEFSNRIFDLRSLFFEARTYGTVGDFLELFGTARRANSVARATQRATMVLPRLVLEVLLFAALLGLTLYLTATGSFVESLALLGFALAAGLKITSSLIPIQSAVAELRTYIPMAERTHQMIEDLQTVSMSPSSPARTAHPQDFTPANEYYGPLSVSVNSVSLKFEDALEPAIKDISLEIAQGEFVAFVGPTGAGKSTLANLILGLEKADSGEVRLSGKDPTDESLQRLGRLAYVPQNPGLLHGSWADNVLLYREKLNPDLNVEQASRILGMDDLSWVETESAHIKSMSGGQKQLLALLRAVVNSPGLLVLDEFSSAMDPSLEALIMQGLKNIRPKTTIVAIAHRLSTIREADVIYLIENGRIRNSGSFGELSADDELFNKFLRASRIEGSG